MAINTQKIFIPMTKGVNQKADELTFTENQTVENYIFNKKGAIEKRKGYDTVENEATLLTGINKITTYKNQLLAFTFNEMNTLKFQGVSNNADFVPIDDFSLANVTKSNVKANNNEQINMTSASNDYIRVIAYVEDDIDYVEVYDINSGVMVTREVLTSVADKGKVHIKKSPADDGINIFYHDTDSFLYGLSAKTVSNVGNISGATSLVKAIHADSIFDVFASDLVPTVPFYVIHKSTTANECDVLAISTLNAVLGTITMTSMTPIAGSSISIHAQAATDTTIHYNMFWYESLTLTTGCKSALYSSGTSGYIISPVATHPTNYRGTSLSEYKVTQIDYKTGVSITMFNTRSNHLQFDRNQIMIIVVDIDNGIYYTMDYDYTDGILKGSALSTNAYKLNDKIYFGTYMESELQPTSFVFSFDVIPAAVATSLLTVWLKEVAVAKYNTLLAGTYSKHDRLAEPTITANGAEFLSGKKTRLLSNNGDLYSLEGIDLIDFNVNDASLSTIETNNSLYIAGGIPSTYDGASLVENGFNHHPETTALTIFGAGTGVLTAGDYQYVAVYSWTDNNGNIYKSAPSLPLSITATALDKASVTVSYLNITQKEDVKVDIYRTEADGTVFYKLNAYTTDNVKTTVDVVFNDDATSDTQLVGNELLYTTGGILEHISTGNADIAVEHKNRVWLAGQDDPLTISYSKYLKGEGVQFSAFLNLQMETEGGDITALASFNSNLIVFKKSAIYTVSGDGANDLGINSTLTEPFLVSSDIGCINKESLVQTETGIYFKSNKGIYKMDRGLNISYIGAQVEDYNSQDVKSATSVSAENEIRFVVDTDILVYNTEFGQWSTFDITAADSVLFEDKHTIITGDKVKKQNTDNFDNTSDGIVSTLTTGWLKLQGVQGLQRVKKIGFAFTQVNIFSVDISINYDDTVVQTINFAGDTYNELEHLVYRLDKQKCISIKFSIRDNTATYPGGSSTNTQLSGITLEVGLKKGFDKIKVTN